MALFIGGPLDGKLIAVDPNRDHVEVAIDHSIEGASTKPNKITDIFYYKREVLECPASQTVVFVPRSYTCDEVMAALIQGYHENVQSQS